MPNKYTIETAIKIEEMLSKLWVDGDISSYSRSNIMEIVNKELKVD